MAHNLNFRKNGEAQVVVARIDAWHMLGTKLENCFSAADGMLQIDLPDYIYKVPMFLPVLQNIENLTPLQIKNAYLDAEKGIFNPALWRFDKMQHFATLDVNNGNYAAPLGYVGESYSTIQIPKMFEVCDALVGDNLAIYDSMGALDGGRKVFASLRLNDVPGFTLPNGDAFDTYLNCVNSFDGTLAAQWHISHVRQVCWNTVQMSLNAAKDNFLRIKHTSGAIDTIERSMLDWNGILASSIEDLQNRITFLNSKLCTDSIMEQVFAEAFGLESENGESVKVSTRRKHVLGEVIEFYNANDNNTFKDERGTMFNLLNAIVEFADYAQQVRVTERSATDNRNVLRAESAVLGNGARLKQRAIAAIEKAAQTAPDKPGTAFVPVEVQLVDGTVEVEMVEVAHADSALAENDSAESTVATPLLDDILNLA